LSAGELVAKGQALAALLHHPCGVGLHPPRALPVVGVEMQSVGIVGGDQLASGPGIGVLPRHLPVGVDVQLRRLL
jgi:hypothetical protein